VGCRLCEFPTDDSDIPSDVRESEEMTLSNTVMPASVDVADTVGDNSSDTGGGTTVDKSALLHTSSNQ
jgi:hypothetical protein